MMALMTLMSPITGTYMSVLVNIGTQSFLQGKKRCQGRFNTFVKLILQCFQGLPQEGDLGSVLELFKLTFHSQAP